MASSKPFMAFSFTTDTDISLGHIYTGMLEQGSDQFDIITIIHIDIRCEAFTKAMRTYPIKTKIIKNELKDFQKAIKNALSPQQQVP